MFSILFDPLTKEKKILICKVFSDALIIEILEQQKQLILQQLTQIDETDGDTQIAWKFRELKYAYNFLMQWSQLIEKLHRELTSGGYDV